MIPIKERWYPGYKRRTYGGGGADPTIAVFVSHVFKLLNVMEGEEGY